MSRPTRIALYVLLLCVATAGTFTCRSDEGDDTIVVKPTTVKV